MQRKLVPLAAFVAVFALAGAQPLVQAHGAFVDMRVTAHDGGGEYWFTVTTAQNQYEGRNPTIALEPGTRYDVFFENPIENQASHNFHVGAPLDLSTDVIPPGNETRIQFTVPNTAPDAYWCDPHQGQRMQGTVVNNESKLPENQGGEGSDDGSTNGTPGFGAAAAVASVAALALAHRRTRRD